MSPVRRLLAVAVVVALAVSGVALGARGDPQKKINPADQARAKQMLLRKADFPGHKSTPPSQSNGDPYCRALDESDLTLTGEAESPNFEPRKLDPQTGLLFATSVGQVYESLADANASWRRGTSAAGEKCIRDIFRRAIQKGGNTFVSFRRMPFPRLAQRTAAFRLIATSQGVPIHLDFAVLMQSRAHASVLMGVVPVKPKNTELERLSRIVASRLKTAMRGA
jgi:hypothetical protein